MKIDQHVKASRTLPLIRKTAVATLVSSVFVLASGGVAVAAERVIDVDTSGENGTNDMDHPPPRIVTQQRDNG